MYERASYDMIILSSIGIVPLSERRLKPAHVISVLVLILIHQDYYKFIHSLLYVDCHVGPI